MSSTNNVSGSSSYNGLPSTTSSSKTTAPGLDTNFMQLLMAQMTHQNPLEPMKDVDMMSQMAQLNSVQELQTIKQSMQEMLAANQASYAASLVGKNVTAQVGDKTVQGAVSEVTIENAKVYLQVGDDRIPLAAVTSISAEEDDKDV